ncbi:hypothetical protein A3A60_00090 [Candidatus Curtissbacteria bacterium RIFCSPLOWO2_01_FULL_42_26]|uniref:Uncharacterized protein n=1 Tax=Candidatus Curtissbacteria bacterium RIFCSPLOWO2_01_FULL_42_26 TaxID=1797729 RepID=A0A1F5I0E7_9BACT|nr:MAG: hypothetical protein A3A60_00090 [Candidatus Curtissbacteria bacterium RIFCSPLOWO2_01_FULL_42_26]
MAGKIFIYLLLILSISGLILVKTIIANPPQDPDIYQQKTYALSANLGDPNKWRIYQNQLFGYQIKHPDSWETQENKRRSFNVPSSYEAYLGSKIKLTVSVHKLYEIPKSALMIKSGDHEFYIIEDKGNIKSAVTQENSLYYMIELENNGFFESSSNFRGTFYTFLKNFVFTS